MRSEVSEAGGNSRTCVRAGEGKVLIGNQAGPGNIVKATHGFLPLVYRLLDCRFKSHDTRPGGVLLPFPISYSFDWLYP